jgi:hypothetical protein
MSLLDESALKEISPEAKLICGLIGRMEVFSAAEALLQATFGKIDGRSEVIQFGFTDYYQAEMGRDLSRQWVSFEGTITQAEIVRAKLKTIGMERELADSSGKRRVNLDPGFVSGAKLVLASTKDFSHRIYLWGGIFAEVTLIFEHGSFVPLKWSYPDYQTDTAMEFFKSARNSFLRAVPGGLKT